MAPTAWLARRLPDRADGYVFPPLWGADSFNDGAGMHRLLTAARFIKAKMPLGQPDLTDDQAFDVAAFINSKPRPQMANLDRDYPDRVTKPVDGPTVLCRRLSDRAAPLRTVHSDRAVLQIPEALAPDLFFAVSLVSSV